MATAATTTIVIAQRYNEENVAVAAAAAEKNESFLVHNVNRKCKCSNQLKSQLTYKNN